MADLADTAPLPRAWPVPSARVAEVPDASEVLDEAFGVRRE
jgi:hypothetical protein